MTRPQSPTTFAPIGARWSATAQTPTGPFTAVGNSMGEAAAALDHLIAIARALEVSRDRESR
jgi:hypothetical protein